MTKNLMIAVAIILSIPVVVFAQNFLKHQQRVKNYQVLCDTSQQMRQLTLAIHHYSLDWKRKMPPMQNPVVFQQALQRYTTKDNFISVASGQSFMPNAKLSGKPLVQSNVVVWCYDVKPVPGPNSPKELYRVVGYSNHVITMPEKRWQREKKDAGLP